MLSVERPTPTGRANYPQFHLTGRTLYLTDRAVYITYLYHNATAAGMAGRIITLSYRQSSLHYHITIYYIYYILHILYTTYTTYTIYYIYYILHILYTTYTIYYIYYILHILYTTYTIYYIYCIYDIYYIRISPLSPIRMLLSI